jgi:Outer membrane protein beta-barrel domain
MKENNFYSDDFEQLIRGKTEQYKMYPSENVWKGVHNALHTRRKWFIAGMAALVTGILFFAGKELITPARVITLHRPASAQGIVSDAANGDNDATRSSAGAEENTVPGANDLTAAAPLAAIRPSNNAPARRDAANGSDDTEERDEAYSGISITLGHPVLTQSDLSDWLSRVVRLPEQAPDLAVIATRTTTSDQGKIGEDALKVADDGLAEHKEDAGKGNNENAASGIVAGRVENASGAIDNLSARGAQHSRLQNTNAGRAGIRGKNYLPDSAASAAKASGAVIAKAEDMQRINWLQDYAMNVLDASPKHGRTYLQLTLAPTVNYRTIGGNNLSAEKFPQQTGPYAQLLNNPQAMVGHSPAIGFEVGGSILYRVTRNLSIKGGLQFNFNRYSMTAYVSRNQNPMNSTYGYVLDSLNSSVTSGSASGRTAATIDNDYFQLSAPVGFELRVLGNERLQFNIGATVQPSYLLNTDSYMLTEDYHDYDKSPNKFRRWNINGGVEAFLTYRTGDIRWQVGPEFRYQMFSSYISQYQITENLKGYGLKIGITKMLP